MDGTKLFVTSPGVNGAEPSLQDQQAASGLNSRLRYVSSPSCSRHRSPRPHHQDTLVQQDHLEQDGEENFVIFTLSLSGLVFKNSFFLNGIDLGLCILCSWPKIK